MSKASYPTLSPALFEKMTKEAKGKPCMLCGGDPDMMAAFIPDQDKAQDFGGQKGKLRIFFYTLCSPCQEASLQDGGAEVEAALQANVVLSKTIGGVQ